MFCNPVQNNITSKNDNFLKNIISFNDYRWQSFAKSFNICTVNNYVELFKQIKRNYLYHMSDFQLNFQGIAFHASMFYF